MCQADLAKREFDHGTPRPVAHDGELGPCRARIASDATERSTGNALLFPELIAQTNGT